MAITINIVEGERGRKTRRGWQERERLALVSRLDPLLTGHAKLDAAIAALQADPDNRAGFGDEHPTSSRVFLEELAPEAETSADVRIRMLYRVPEFSPSDTDDADLVIEVGTSLSQITANTDANGDLMTVEYNGLSQSGSVSVYVPESTVRYQVRKSGSPGALSRNYVGKVNSGGWLADPGAAARTWLCTALGGVSDDGGDTFLVTAEFAYREDTYDETVVYIDPETGRMPDDIVDGTGIVVFQVYTEANFNGIF